MINIKKWYKNIIDGDVDTSKRKVIKTAAGLAALTVVAKTSINILEDKTKTIQEKIDSGLISGEHFYLYEPIIIDIPNVKIMGCMFEAVAMMPYMLKFGPNATNTLVTSCVFERNGLTDICIKIEPHETINKSNELQAAFDYSSDGVVRLEPGIYRLDNPIINNRVAPIALDDSVLLFKPFSGTTYA